MLSRYTLSVAALIALVSCSRQPTDATLVGTWDMPKSTYRIVFHPNHTLDFTNGQGTTNGTWIIADGRLTTTLRQPSMADEESVDIYRSPKIRRSTLFFGPSRTFSRVGGRQIGEGEELVTGAVYQRVQ